MAKWTEELVQALQNKVQGKESVTADEVTAFATEMELSYKEIAGKLRSMGVAVEKKAVKAKAYTEQEERKLQKLVQSGAFIEDIAATLGRTVPQIRGKLLSMKLKAPQKNKKEQVKVYSEEVIAKIKEMDKQGRPQEEIADALGLNLAGLKSQMTKLGLTTKKEKSKFWTPEKVAEAISLFNNTSDTLDVLAEKLGTTYPLLAKVLKKEGINYETRKPRKKVQE